MTTEELLKPRYKVIADFWGNHFEVGKILELKKENGSSSFEYTWYGHDGLYSRYESDFKDYPHLFRKLEWWEDRKVEDMPKYIRGIKSGRIIRVHKWDLKCEQGWICSDGFNCYHRESILPATESEYLEYKKSKVTQS